jgi:NADPH-dependent glutamate synthase beta subunit-like oxidoreductase/ferredoxin
MPLIETFVNHKRMSTQELLQLIYSAVEQGQTEFEINASGQHDIGGPLWTSDGRPLRFVVRNPGQRVGSMALPGTTVIVEGPAPADVGWLNAGATIIVKGDGGDTTGHCAADGVIYIGGRAGTRSGSLMKHDPDYDPPQLWILKNTGSFPFEFKGGGISVVCGYDSEQFDSVLGDRGCVGMVGGMVYVRGPIQGLSDEVKLIDQVDDKDWEFLADGMPRFLNAIDRLDLLDELLVRAEWRKIVARTYAERKYLVRRQSLAEFHQTRWVPGGIFGDVVTDDGTLVPLVTTGQHRIQFPVWNNARYAAPCEVACPSNIPTQCRTNLLRQGRIREALELVLQYSPFPGSVCGALCPNPCMAACTRGSIDCPVLIGPLGQLSADIEAPPKAPPTGKKFAVIGAGMGGLSAAWQLALRGHAVTVYDRSQTPGGKLSQAIPRDRRPVNVVEREIERIRSVGVHFELGTTIDRELFERLRAEHDGVIIAIGAHEPRTLSFPGSQRAIPALTFLQAINAGQSHVDVAGKSVVVIGAGDVGMDVSRQAWRLGAREVTAIDIQKPASSEKECRAAMALGTCILWPKFAREALNGNLHFTDGTSLRADVIIVSIGEVPDTDWLPEDLVRVRGRWLQVDDVGRTSDPRVFAVGDVVKLGLLAEAIGAGRIAALALHGDVTGIPFERPKKEAISRERLHLTYFQPWYQPPTDPLGEAARCISCGTCRDCNMCIEICGQGAIYRVEPQGCGAQFIVDDGKCIGCGFCAAVCPCGIWTMVPNVMEYAEA